MNPWIVDLDDACAQDAEIGEEEALEELFEMNPLSAIYHYKGPADYRGIR